MAWFRRHSRAILAVLGGGIGAILGAVVQELLNTDLRVVAAIATVLAMLAIGTLAALGALIDSHRGTNDQLLGDARALVAAIDQERAEQNAVLSRTSSILSTELRNLSAQFGLRVSRLLLSDVNAMETLDEDKSAQLIFSVQEELCVLDILSEEGHWPDESMDSQHSEDFFRELIRLIDSLTPGVAYKRIVQVMNPTAAPLRAKSSTFIGHCHDMLDMREERNSRVSLRVARTRFPFKFMLIDRSRLVLQLQEYGQGEQRLTIWGEILIEDPSKQLVSIFREIWDQIDDDPLTRTIIRRDLPSRVQQPSPSDPSQQNDD
ncbi:hypothetical protein ACFY0F_30550 [Streptomyces sp. NPDC001544]|uniref:hypothetical protein n=1 Tax=Streptomyces sp. NPDC001544 TaxID=3364584 RepID=UPI0036C83FC5